MSSTSCHFTAPCCHADASGPHSLVGVDFWSTDPSSSDAKKISTDSLRNALIGGSPLDTNRAAAALGVQAGVQEHVLRVVSVLQELLALSTSAQRAPLSRTMALLVNKLSLDWACLSVVSPSGQTYMQAGAALSPEAQRLRGASGSAMLTPGSAGPSSAPCRTNRSATSAGNLSAPAGLGGVYELGASEPQSVSGSNSSVRLVLDSKQAVAMCADGDRLDQLPADWARLYKDRDLKVHAVVLFCCVMMVFTAFNECKPGCLDQCTDAAANDRARQENKHSIRLAAFSTLQGCTDTVTRCIAWHSLFQEAEAVEFVLCVCCSPS